MKTARPPFPTPEAAAASMTQLALSVFRLNGELLQWGDQLVAPLGLTSARWQMLGALALAAEPLTAPKVGEAMGVTRQGALKQLTLLTELGLVKASANPAHRRSPLYSLTPQGAALYQKADEAWTRQAAELATRIPPKNTSIAHDTLETLRQLLRDHPPVLKGQS